MKLTKYFSIVLLAAVLLAGCKPDEFSPIGDARNVLKQMEGTYTLTKVTEIDNDALKNDFPYKTMDITRFYTGLKVNFTLKADAAGTFTFTPGTGSNIVNLTSGEWSVDNAEAPKVITLKNGAVTETIQMGSYTALDASKLKLQRVRSSNDKVLITYDYEFTKN